MRRGDIGAERVSWRSGRMEVAMWEAGGPQGLWDGEALEEGYEGAGEANMWEAELAVLLEAESAGVAGPAAAGAVAVGPEPGGEAAGGENRWLAPDQGARGEDGTSPSR